MKLVIIAIFFNLLFICVFTVNNSNKQVIKAHSNAETQAASILFTKNT